MDIVGLEREGAAVGSQRSVGVLGSDDQEAVDVFARHRPSIDRVAASMTARLMPWDVLTAAWLMFLATSVVLCVVTQRWLSLSASLGLLVITVRYGAFGQRLRARVRR